MVHLVLLDFKRGWMPRPMVRLTLMPAMQERLSGFGFVSRYLDVTSGPTGYKKKPRRKRRDLST
jgi:hypothetical protein